MQEIYESHWEILTERKERINLHEQGKLHTFLKLILPNPGITVVSTHDKQTLLFSFYRCLNWGTESLHNLFKVTQLKCDSAQTYESKSLLNISI